MGKMMRKAIFFSIVSLLLVTMFIATSEVSTKSRAQETELDVSRTRVRILNSMVNDLDQAYFEKMMFVASKNALTGLSHYYADNNFASTKIKKSLHYAMADVLYNTVLYDERGVPQANLSKLGYMDYRYSVEGLSKELNRLFEKRGVRIISLNITLSPIRSITMPDPWTITVNSTIQYYISDEQNIASWKGFISKTVDVPVYGLYLYDSEGGPNSRSNIGRVNLNWKLDNGTNTEASAIRKLGEPNTQQGICLDYCQEG